MQTSKYLMPGMNLSVEQKTSKGLTNCSLYQKPPRVLKNGLVGRPRALCAVLSGATDLTVGGGGRRAQSCCLCQLLRSPAPEGQQSLHVLARGYKQSFPVYLPEPP